MTATEKRQELDATRGNRRVQIHSRAIEIVRNSPGIVTMLEAVRRAEAELGFTAGSYAAR